MMPPDAKNHEYDPVDGPYDYDAKLNDLEGRTFYDYAPPVPLPPPSMAASAVVSVPPPAPPVKVDGPHDDAIAAAHACRRNAAELSRMSTADLALGERLLLLRCCVRAVDARAWPHRRHQRGQGAVGARLCLATTTAREPRAHACGDGPRGGRRAGRDVRSGGRLCQPCSVAVACRARAVMSYVMSHFRCARFVAHRYNRLSPGAGDAAACGLYPIGSELAIKVGLSLCGSLGGSRAPRSRIRVVV